MQCKLCKLQTAFWIKYEDMELCDYLSRLVKKEKGKKKTVWRKSLNRAYTICPGINKVASSDSVCFSCAGATSKQEASTLAAPHLQMKTWKAALVTGHATVHIWSLAQWTDSTEELPRRPNPSSLPSSNDRWGRRWGGVNKYVMRQRCKRTAHLLRRNSSSVIIN